jgi:AcrR family transcriptional regulator
MNQEKLATERLRGRPAVAGQPDLRLQILGIAEELFATHGYAATSVRQIAEQAGVNPALVHYYFGNKKALLQSVMESSLQPLVEAIATLRDDPATSPETIVRLLLSMAARHPNIPRLMTREVLLPGGEMKQHFADNMAPGLGGALPGLLGQAQTTGRVRQDVDPAISSMLILALCMFPFIARDLAEPVLGVRFDDAGIELLTQQISQLLRQGIEL